MAFTPIIKTRPTQSATSLMQQAKISTDNSIQSLIDQMANLARVGWSRVWEPTGYTTAQILALYGTQAAELFRLDALLVTAVESAHPGTLETKYKAVGAAVNYADDGTVRLTTPPA